jgi:hypothetical protein
LLFVFAKHNKPRFGGVCYLARYRYNARLPKLADLLDSRRDATNNGLVAQSVEQRIENPCVGGSIPPRATRFSKAYISVSLFYFLQFQVNSAIVEDIKNISAYLFQLVAP